jgi:segregation and condensation protein A
VSPLGELHIRWAGSDEGDVEVDDEFDVQPEPGTDDDGGTGQQAAVEPTAGDPVTDHEDDGGDDDRPR